MPECNGEVNPSVVWIIENTPISNCEGAVVELFEKTKREREGTESDSFQKIGLRTKSLISRSTICL